jgi:oligopeptide/dipeptide ABC transporter ATP-binding protein
MIGAVDALVRCTDVTKTFPVKGQWARAGILRALEGVSVSIDEGETLGLVGESGSGKSTFGRTILQLYRPTSGKVYYRDRDLTSLSGPALRAARRHMQIVFQDPLGALNPRYDVHDLIAEPLVAHGIGGRSAQWERVVALLDLVQLGAGFADKFPHEMSGGQRQRVAIARALALQPKFLVLDEPVAALDVSIQAQIVNLLQGLQDKFGLTYLFIAHDLGLIRHISRRVAVMYLGRIVELAGRDSLFRNAFHPYTRALISAVPIANPPQERARSRIVLEGEVPSPLDPPAGCRFHTRCPFAQNRCRHEPPERREIAREHWIECHFPLMTPPDAARP